MKNWTIMLLLNGVLIFGCSEGLASETDETKIEESYKAWTRATNAKDIESWSSFLAPGALFVPPGVPPLKTKEAILNYYNESFADPEFALDCQQLEVNVAKSKEMAWARGVCHATFTGPTGKRELGTSHWFKVWLKQLDGSWKCRFNTWNYESE